MGSIQRLHLVYHTVPDLDRAVAFYRDVLGLPMTYYDDLHRDWADFGLGGAKLSVALEDQTTSHRCPTVVLGVSEIEDLVGQLTEKGVIFSGSIRDFPFGKLVGLHDPFGNYLELLEWRRREHT